MSSGMSEVGVGDRLLCVRSGESPVQKKLCGEPMLTRLANGVGSCVAIAFGVTSCSLCLSLVGPNAVHAQGMVPPAALQLEATQNEANSKAGPRSVPAKVLPVPTTVSKEMQAAIASAYLMPKWTANHPQSAADWKKVVDGATKVTMAALPGLREKLGVSVEQISLGGVNAYVVTPQDLPAANKNRVALYFHGGGFVYNPGEAGTWEAILMAAYGGYRVISVDYRMPPDDPYPAGLDDAVNAYKAVVKQYGAEKVAVFGTSAGGGLTLSLMLRIKAEKLPMPGAIAPETPYSDLTEEGGGDSMKTNEWVDGSLISYNGYIRHSSLAYANGHDPKDPLISPIYGDWHGFPPAIIATGTRDLFLSLSALTHRKLRQAGVEAELHVWEGQSHAQYYVPYTPETKEQYAEISRFFSKHLAR